MYQIDTPDVANALPTPAALATIGFFTDGDPALDIEATTVSADWLNALMLELLAILTAAGITPSKTMRNQVLTAIETLIEARSGNYALDTGAANAYVVALSPPITAYTDGLGIRARLIHGNTGASTINAGAGAVALLRDDGAPVQLGDIPADSIVTATYLTASSGFRINSVVLSQIAALPDFGLGLAMGMTL